MRFQRYREYPNGLPNQYRDPKSYESGALSSDSELYSAGSKPIPGQQESQSASEVVVVNNEPVQVPDTSMNTEQLPLPSTPDEEKDIALKREENDKMNSELEKTTNIPENAEENKREVETNVSTDASQKSETSQPSIENLSSGHSMNDTLKLSQKVSGDKKKIKKSFATDRIGWFNRGWRQ